MLLLMTKIFGTCEKLVVVIATSLVNPLSSVSVAFTLPSLGIYYSNSMCSLLREYVTESCVSREAKKCMVTSKK